MKNIIRKKTANLYLQKGVRKYEFTLDGLNKFVSLSKRSQQIIVDILHYVGYKYTIDSITVEISYKELGFKSYSNLRKYRKELVDSELIYHDDNKYFINPCYINFYTRRQKEYFFKYFGIKKDTPVVMNDPTVIKFVSNS